ncbi:MAG: hypothetical protein R3E76_06995 [Planctomycetota bacterium]
MNEWKKTKIDYELWIHRIPDDLKPPLPPEREHLQETYEVWKRVFDAKVCWRIARIDEWNNLWIDIRFKNDAGELEDHSLAVDEDCYEKIESAEYEVEVELP